MAEKNAENVRQLRIMDLENERTVATGGLEAIKRGQLCGMAAVIIFATLAGLAVVNHLPALAIAICTVTIGAVTTVFVTGQKYKHQQENKSSDGDQS